MPIFVPNFDTTVRNPGVFVSIDPSKANSGQVTLRSLLIGQIKTTGRAEPFKPLFCSGVAQAKEAGGPGSQLALMTAAYRRQDPNGELWLLPLLDDDASAQAEAEVALFALGTATAAGTLSLYVAGRRIQVGVPAGGTGQSTGAQFAAAVNATEDLPVAAEWSQADGVLLLRADNAGQAGNDLDVRWNYLGSAGGEQFPFGMRAPPPARFTGGTGAPDLTVALSNLVDQPFDIVAHPYTDAANLDALREFLDDQQGRWSPVRQVYGHAFTAFRGSLGAALTLLGGRNDQHATIMPYADAPEPPFVWAADLAGTVAPSLRANPAVPLQPPLPMGVMPPALGSEFGFGDRNALLYSGGATFEVTPDRVVNVSRCVTTYRRNAAGSPDDSYLDTETLFQLAFVCRFFRADLSGTYTRKIVVPDDTRFATGSAMVTPSIIRGHVVAKYRELERNGMVAESRAFARDLQVEIAQRGQVRILAPVHLTTGLRQIVTVVQFDVALGVA